MKCMHTSALLLALATASLAATACSDDDAGAGADGDVGPGGAGDAGAGPDGPPPPTAWPPLETSVPTWELLVDEARLQALYDKDPWFTEYIAGEFVSGDFRAPVTLRWRGAGTLKHPKKSWKVKFLDGIRFEGRARLNLLAEWHDGGYLTDKLAYDLMNAAHVPAPRARYVNLEVNGEYRGVYTEVEDVDKPFFRARGLDRQANIYRCGSRDCELKVTPPAPYQKPWEKRTNEDQPWDDLWAMLDLVARTPEGELEATVARAFDLDAYLRYMAVSILISNFGIDDSGSFLVHELGRDRWLYVPWDLNNAKMLYWRIDDADDPPWVDRPIPFFTVYDPYCEKVWEYKRRKFGDAAQYAWSVLSTRIWDRPALRARVLDHVEELTAALLSPEQVAARVDAMVALIAPDVARDPYVSPEHMARAPQFMKDYWTGRLAYLAKALPAARAHGDGPLVIDALRPAEGGGVAVELLNRGDAPLDTSGLTITTDLRRQFGRPLDVGVLAPGSRATVVLPLDPAGGEVGVFDGVNRWGALDAVFYGPLPSGGYGRRPSGTEDWGPL